MMCIQCLSIYVYAGPNESLFTHIDFIRYPAPLITYVNLSCLDTALPCLLHNAIFEAQHTLYYVKHIV